MPSPRASRSDASGTGRPLVIVESPAKAKTISGFLGSDFTVEASIGHIRDLPRKAADVPASEKGKPWAKLGVDVDNGFLPLYLVAPEKKAQVSRLKDLLKGASELYLATDEDREGEAIAWHLLEVLKPKIPVKRMVFHEITRPAIQRAVDEWRELDRSLVDAQEARRILDRLYGYEVSPVLWKKVMPGLSAGRVQSVATRLIVERERARMRFRSAGWWDLQGQFVAEGAAEVFGATMTSVGGKRVASGRDFDELGQLSADVVVLNEADATGLAARLADTSFAVRALEEKPYRRSPYAPFMTSTLQQEAGRKLRFSSQRAMSIAQRLYENGYITYMRTDSTNLSDTALDAARAQVLELYGAEYLPAKPRTYVKKVKNAQEAHEAIRPAGETFRTPASLRNELTPDELSLYELIWKRTIASQMNDATGTSATVRLGGLSSTGEDVEFSASGKVITFPGFLRAYVEGSDDPEAELEDRETRLPNVTVGQAVSAQSIEPKGHTTQPPARYTEASLVKALEELGVGRPSTYASIMETVQNRGYVWKKGSALVPSITAFAVVGLLEQHFGDLVDYAFTARMEDDLDAIAAGDAKSTPWLTKFYFGSGGPGAPGASSAGVRIPNGPAPSLSDVGLKELVDERTGSIDAAEVNTILLGVDADGADVVVKPGRYGTYVKRNEDTASVPDDLAPDELTVEKVLELLAAPKGERVVGVDPTTSFNIYAKTGRFGPYVQLGELPAKGSKDPKPPMSSLFKSMTVDTITLEQALQLLSLPRVVGTDPADGQEIVASNGKFGPYLRKGTDSRNIATEEELLTITVDQAAAIYAQPKERGRRGAAAPKGPLREVGVDPISGKLLVIKDGRFGAYVTDGETNASLRKGDDVEEVTIDRAMELLAERRIRIAAEPAKTIKRGGVKKSAVAKTTSGRAKAAAKKK
jgi:DNA topoisomerase I